MMNRNKLFEKICCMTQPKLKNWLVNRLTMLGKETIVNGDGFIYASGEFPVLLTAHMDTVHHVQCKKPRYTTTKGGDTAVYEPNGIGGDDRCGIYMILKLLEKLDCAVLFCEDEEIGSIGARKFVKTDLCKSLKGKFKYIIELDRANDNDAVFYDDDNTEFHKFVLESFWQKAIGSWSDICTLSPELEVSSVNFSCGYYKAHTTNEYVVLDEMERSIEEVYKLLKRTDLEAEPFKFIERQYYTSFFTKCYGGGTYDYNHGYRSSYWDDDEWDWYSADSRRTDAAKEDVPTKTITKAEDRYLEVILLDGTYLNAAGESIDELWHNFFFENPDVCYNDICDYYVY